MFVDIERGEGGLRYKAFGLHPNSRHFKPLTYVTDLGYWDPVECA
jgi:hypothetical protein